MTKPYCALTEASVPAIERLDNNVFAVIGFSSPGLVLANTLGREMAHFLAGKKTEAELPLPVGPAHPVPFQAIKIFLGGMLFRSCRRAIVCDFRDLLPCYPFSTGLVSLV